VGIDTRVGLTETVLAHVPKLDPPVFERLKEQAALQIESVGTDPPSYRVLPPDPSSQGLRPAPHGEPHANVSPRPPGQSHGPHRGRDRGVSMALGVTVHGSIP
jgi:hypothetical protein